MKGIIFAGGTGDPRYSLTLGQLASAIGLHQVYSASFLTTRIESGVLELRCASLAPDLPRFRQLFPTVTYER
jgi:hypothetical protein